MERSSMTQPGQDQEHSTGELVKMMTEQVSVLIRDELKLAQLEMTGKGKQAALGAGMFGASGVVALYGVGCLLACAIIAISGVVAAWLAALIVGAALLAAGRQLAVDRGVMTGDAQRNRVGVAANDCRLALAEFAWRFGQTDLSAHQSRSLSRERDLKFRLARQGAQATGDCPLEWFGRRFFRRRLGFDVGGHHAFPLCSRAREVQIMTVLR